MPPSMITTSIPFFGSLCNIQIILSKMFQILTIHDIKIGRNPRLNLSTMTPNFEKKKWQISFQVYSHDFNRNLKSSQ